MMELDVLVLRNWVVPDLTLVVCVILLGRVGGGDMDCASAWLSVSVCLWRVCVVVLVGERKGPCGALIQPVTLLGDGDGVQRKWTSAGVSGVYHRY